MRLFIAMDIPEDVRAAIAALASKLQSVCATARWVSLDGAHVTLKFIGEVPRENLEEIKAALTTVAFPAPFKIFFRGTGFFPNERRPQVLWAGIETGPDLRALAAAVETSLEPLGIARDRRQFSPHVTFARFKSAKKLDGLRAAIAAAAPLDFGQSTATEFHLYQSILKPAGAEYTRMASFRCASLD